MTKAKEREIEHFSSKIAFCYREADRTENKREKYEYHKTAKAAGIQMFVESKLDEVRRMKKQLTEGEAKSLLGKYSRKAVKDILEQMDNYKPLLQKYTSVYRTCLNWLDRDKKKYSLPEWQDDHGADAERSRSGSEVKPGTRYIVKGKVYEGTESGSLMNVKSREIIPPGIASRFINLL